MALAPNIREEIENLFNETYNKTERCRPLSFSVSPLVQALHDQGVFDLSESSKVHDFQQRQGHLTKEVSCILATNKFDGIYRLTKTIKPFVSPWDGKPYNYAMAAVLNFNSHRLLPAAAKDVITKLVGSYKTGESEANLDAEQEVLEEFVGARARNEPIATTWPSVLLVNEDEVVVLRHKSPQPNDDEAKSLKESLLTARLLAIRAFPGKQVSTYLAAHFYPDEFQDERRKPFEQYFDKAEFAFGRNWLELVYGEDEWDDYVAVGEEVAAYIGERVARIRQRFAI